MTQQQASTSVSPLRRRMLDDMAMRGLHEDTRWLKPAPKRTFSFDRLRRDELLKEPQSVPAANQGEHCKRHRAKGLKRASDRQPDITDER